MAKTPDNIRGALALATCSLLAPGAAQSAAGDADAWDVDSAVLFYSEKDRVDVVEPAFTARKDLGNDEYLTIRGTLDTMTGASPNGATTTDRVQTFTGASGNKTYTVPANTLPTVEFRAARVALGADWEKPGDRRTRAIIGGNVSLESDYFSFGASQRRRKRGHGQPLTKKTGLPLDPYFSGTKIAWLLDNVPGARRRAEAGELLAGTIDCFLLWRLTGGRVHATDATNASRTLLYNIAKQAWDDELLKILRVPRRMLPDVRDCAADFGATDPAVLGAAVPVLCIAGDHPAATIGQACFRPGLG